ncbi:MAG TPA: hypothetical protein VMX35_09245 [Acidobacteriota bacterium]|nr:hypothetical protein [Acidobacteriota bacterium]
MKKMILVAAAAVLAGSFGLAMSVSVDDVTPPEPEKALEVLPPQEDTAAEPAPPTRFWRHDWLKTELGLTDEQSAKLEQMRSEHWKAQIELKAKLQVAGIELAELMKTKGNDDAVLQKAAEISALRNQTAEMMVRNQLDRRAVFTDEQWEKVSKLQSAVGYMKMRHGDRRFDGRHGRGMDFHGRSDFGRRSPARRDRDR